MTGRGLSDPPGLILEMPDGTRAELDLGPMSLLPGDGEVDLAVTLRLDAADSTAVIHLTEPDNKGIRKVTNVLFARDPFLMADHDYEQGREDANEAGYEL